MRRVANAADISSDFPLLRIHISYKVGVCTNHIRARLRYRGAGGVEDVELFVSL